MHSSHSRDNVERAKKSGVKYIAQPGGSVRDDLVIECADKYDMVMCIYRNPSVPSLIGCCKTEQLQKENCESARSEMALRIFGTISGTQREKNIGKTVENTFDI